MPAIGHLSKEQVNAIARAIVAAGLDVNDFRDLHLVECSFTGTERDAVRLEHGSGEYYFDFSVGLSERIWQSMHGYERHFWEWNGGEHCADYSPGAERLRTTVLQVPWTELRDRHLPLWLKRVRGETEGDDLWAKFRAGKE
jgi:hypothetical protein